MSKIPVRTCLSCKKKAGKKELYRFVVQYAEVVFDENNRLPGRGVYCCKQDSCLQRLYKNRKKTAAAFRCNEITWQTDIQALCEVVKKVTR